MENQYSWAALHLLSLIKKWAVHPSLVRSTPKRRLWPKSAVTVVNLQVKQTGDCISLTCQSDTNFTEDMRSRRSHSTT